MEPIEECVRDQRAERAQASRRPTQAGASMRSTSPATGLNRPAIPRLATEQRERHRRHRLHGDGKTRFQDVERSGRDGCTLPTLSRCRISPADRYVTVARPMCGCGRTSSPCPGSNSAGPMRSRKMNGPTILRHADGSTRGTTRGPYSRHGSLLAAGVDLSASRARTAHRRHDDDDSSRPSSPGVCHQSA